jgi:hypothetical protein
VRWLVARLWLGYGWLNAGYQKLWGNEKAVQAEALAGIDVALAMTGVGRDAAVDGRLRFVVGTGERQHRETSRFGIGGWTGM